MLDQFVKDVDNRFYEWIKDTLQKFDKRCSIIPNCCLMRPSTKSLREDLPEYHDSSCGNYNSQIEGNNFIKENW